MSDLRLCTLCNQSFDIESSSIEVLDTSDGGHGRKTTVRDRDTGLVHVLTTKRMTKKKAGATAPDGAT